MVTGLFVPFVALDARLPSRFGAEEVRRMDVQIVRLRDSAAVVTACMDFSRSKCWA
jgi:hypothetical protein